MSVEQWQKDWVHKWYVGEFQLCWLLVCPHCNSEIYVTRKEAFSGQPLCKVCDMYVSSYKYEVHNVVFSPEGWEPHTRQYQ